MGIDGKKMDGNIKTSRAAAIVSGFCGPRLKSQAEHLHFFQFIFEF